MIHGLTRFFTLQDFPTSQQFVNAIRSREAINIKQFELTLRGRVIGSWRELDNLTPHGNHHSSRIMRGLITHILANLWGLLLAGGMTEKEMKSLCCLSTFAWTFPATSAAHFLAFAFLATTFWSKECVMTGIEGLMSSRSVTEVTGTLFRMRNTFCWTVCSHEHLVRLRTQQQLIFPPQFEDGPARLRTLMNQPDVFGVASFVAKCLALFP